MLKKNLLVVLLVLFEVLLIFAVFNKNKLNNYIAQKIQKNTTREVVISVEELITKNYNYLDSSLNYGFTFLEFSSSGCVICKQMEPVLKEMQDLEEVKVNVVFLHIMKPENQEFLKYFGISAVAMQILLDKKGKEFFRHYGFISATDLEAKCLEQKAIK